MTRENRLKDGKRLYDAGNFKHPYAIEYVNSLATRSEELSVQKRAKRKVKKHGSK